MSRPWSAWQRTRSILRSPTARSSRTSGATSRSPARRRSRGPCARALPRRSRSSRARSRPAPSTVASHAAARRRERGSRASARRCPTATTARRTSTSSAPRSRPKAPTWRRRPRRPDGLCPCGRLSRHPSQAIGSRRVSHDTDKLIRQLSLVAFLMAERRAVTAREIKGQVEGYQEMSDEAFARRFYSDRAELLALGVPLDSQRDEFTGEELYRLSSERYFLPALELTDEELAALQTCLYLLEGQFAYAEPLRLALQNLALGRPGFEEMPTETARSIELHDPGYSPELPGRLAKLEGAISKSRTLKFEYWSILRDERRERTVNPYALLFDRGQWYVVGLDLDDDKMKTFRVSRIRGDIRLATRRERDFRLPERFDADEYRLGPPWQIGETVGEARIEVSGDTAWWID